MVDSEIAAPSRGLSILVLLGFLLICFAAAAVGGLFPPGDWYAQLKRPPLTPPGWLFGPAWTLLYTAMAVAAWLVWRSTRHPLRTRALALFFIQLALNALWSPVFFGSGKMALALVVMVCLWLAVAATLVHNFKIHRVAGWLFVPYLAWISFAAYLNAGFLWLNG